MPEFGSSQTLAGDAARGCSAAMLTTGWAMTAVAAALTLAPTATRAQTVNTPVSITVPTILQISGNGLSIGFAQATDADYQAGYASSTSGPTLQHRGNVPYKITIQAQSGGVMAFVPDAGSTDPSKPVGDLMLRATTGAELTSYMPVGAAGTALPLYTRSGSGKGGTLFTQIDAQLLLDYSKDPPGTYSTTVVFTIVPQ